MGLFDLVKKTLKNPADNRTTQPRSRFEHLPLINVEEDQKTPKGYVERKFITEEKLYLLCDNIFFNSNVPIVNRYKQVNKFVSTTVLQERNGKKVRSVNESLFYPIATSLQQEYLQLIAQLNNIIVKLELPARYVFPLDKIVFTPFPDSITKIPISHIQYDQEKCEFYFIFGNQVKENGPYKQSIPVFKSTEHGSITFSEDGTMKNATYTKQLKGVDAVFKFKNYKTGFDLYDIKYNGEILYKRNS